MYRRRASQRGEAGAAPSLTNCSMAMSCCRVVSKTSAIFSIGWPSATLWRTCASGASVPRTTQMLPVSPRKHSTSGHFDQSNCAARRSQADEGVSGLGADMAAEVEEAFPWAGRCSRLGVAVRFGALGFSESSAAD